MNILYFTPHAALWPHTAPEAYLARALSEIGHSVRYLVCGKALTYCAPMTAKGLAPDQAGSKTADKTCQTCGFAAGAISGVYRFPVDALGKYITADEKESLAVIAAEAVKTRSLDTTYLGVKVGYLALYEFTLFHKKMSTELTDQQWTEYGIYLENGLRALHAFSKYIEQDRPDVIMTFSPQYSNINACMHYAMNLGIRVLFNESGTNIAHRLGTMRVWDWKVHGLVNPALTYWGDSDRNRVTEKSANAVANHFEQLLAGKHFAVFSSPMTGLTGARARWSIRADQKIALMTLSSYDEAYAALLVDGFPYSKVFSDVFHTQADWVRATLEWIKDRPDLFLIIRVHPRDFPNKRDSLRSEQSFMLEDLLDNVPANVHVNWPAENVAFYELLDDTDVLLTGWSVTAMEALLLGIPVVTYDSNLPSYPKDIQYTGRSAGEYFDNIERACSDGWRLENAINGFRWLAYNFVDCTVEVSRDFGQFELGNASKAMQYWTRIKNRLPPLAFSLDLLKWKDAREGARIVSAMIEHHDDALSPARARFAGPQKSSPEDERRIILAALARIMQRLYGSSNIAAGKSGNFRKITEILEVEGRH